MKHSFFLLTVFLLQVQFQSFSQSFQGSEAQKVISGSEFVRVDERSGNVEFVQFLENSRFPMSKFPAWAKKALNLEGVELREAKNEVDKLGKQHVRYEVVKNGIPVFGAFIYAHGENDIINSFNGRYPKSIPSATNSISESTALDAAKTFIGAETYKWELPGEEEHLKWETENPNATYFPKGKLVYINPSFDFKQTDNFRLAYMFDVYAHKPVGRYEVFVDSETGEVLFKNDRICSADTPGTAETGHAGTQSIIADSFNDGYRLRETGRGGGIRTFDMNEGTNYGNAVDFTDSDNYWNNVNGNLDQYATDAHWGAEMTYDYFLDEHGRNSIDDANMQINSYVHYDNGYFNAFWDGQRMVYGDGNNSPLTALDICGHEMTHGVTDFSANLIYQDEYGALNESFSDIFGAAVEWVENPSSGDWLMGEDVGTFRSMINPNAYNDPDTYQGDNWYVGPDDNGGVHINSGVQNKWFVILTDGENGINDNGDSYNVSGIGIHNAAAIAYRTLTVYLGPTSEYADARFYSIQAAIDLFGGCSPEVIATTDAWYAVGVGDSFNPTVVSDFAASVTSNCEAPLTVNFSNFSANGETYAWDFGDGTTSNDVNPSHTYSTNGVYTVSLAVDGGNCGTDNLVRTNYISVDPNNPCVALMPDDGSQTLTWCTGTLYDDGGPNENYMDDNSVVTIISPPGATSITLNFSDFAFESGYDYLFIYDGPNTGSPLIGQYDGFNLPNGGTITSSGGSITLRQYSDTYLTEAGFALTWECVQPNSPPTANFYSSIQETCSGEVSFTDQSINGATSWLWDFGDGNTSTDQNPTHTFQNEGSYTVTLTATNSFGSDAVSFNNLIVVDRPDGPSATGNELCNGGTMQLSATGNGTLRWFDQASGGTPIATGQNFTTPNLSSTTTYYVEDAVLAQSYSLGPSDNSFGTGGNFQGDQHLIFDALTAFTLQSVKVYADGTRDRTIQLRDGNGNVLQSSTVNISDGEQTVPLNFSIPQGLNYQLGTTNDPDLFRNNSGPNYPYTVPGVVSITNSSAGIDYYYFFYDWQIETPACVSQRTVVTATVNPSPTVSVSGNTSVCEGGTIELTTNATDADTYLWSTSETTADISVSPTEQTTYSVTASNACGDAVDEITIEVNPLPTISVSEDEAICAGETVLLTSTSNADVEWQPTGETTADISVVPSETTIYYAIATNNCGSVSEGVQITVNPLPQASAGDDVEVCVGQSAEITASGGDSYLWNTGDETATIQVSPLETNLYEVTVTDANGCSDTDEVQVVVNELPIANAGADTAICAGETVVLTASGGQDYSWNTGQQTASVEQIPTITTMYQVEVTDANGCSDTDDVQVTVNERPIAEAGADTAICAGETVELIATGGEIYQWSNQEITDTIQVSPTATTVYEVEVTDSNGCSDVDEVEVVVSLPPTQPSISVNGSQLEASVGSSYQWYLNGTAIESATDAIYQPTEAGDYTVEVFDENGCSSISEPYTWITVGLTEREMNLKIYPVPFSDNLNIRATSPIRKLTVFDAAGRIIFSNAPARNSMVLHSEGWAKGVYTLELMMEQNIIRKRVVKN